MELTKAVLEAPEVLDRSGYIGGTDAPAVLGLSRWKSPVVVWGEKTGLIPADDISDRLPVKLGIRLEDVVAELFTEATGLKVRRVNEPVRHKLHPFIAGRIDRRVVGEEAILECKTTSSWKSKEWETEEIPHEYIIQVMHYLACTGAKRAYIAVLIGNQVFKWKIVERDEQLINDLIAREVEFWKVYVEPKVMPKITKRDGDALFKLFPNAEPESQTEFGDDIVKAIEYRNALIVDKIGLEALIDTTENEIKAKMGNFEAALAGKWKITWKNQTTGRFDTTRFKNEDPHTYNRYIKESQTRVFRVKESK